ncbi:cytochrome P450 [Alishewanella longhuensis]|uniref:Cytochrome P450 n=1 Tax=Alishewanella longhuensis TaxID=1091037 RepID=A0ABQ3L7P5_9ALTE|nr:cytochrome P450 [Alishewanella longhuensis]GHG77799.1 cytochrome P450 [Alishewanella longhuensis]
MKTESQNDWNPLDTSNLKDQRQAYDNMRERCPVAHSEFMGWSLFRHKDITAVLADPKTFSNVSQFLAIPNGMDLPEHGQYRKALDLNFESEQMSWLEPKARKIAAELLESALTGDEVEMVTAFANPFTLKTLCALLGWPVQQWQYLDSWVQGSLQASFDKDSVAGKTLANEFSQYVKANLNKRRLSPLEQTDATNNLMNTKVDGVELDDDQIVSVLRNWTAGHGTVSASLSVLFMHLAENLELQHQLRSDSMLIPAAIEEILRLDGPLVSNPRTTTKEVEIQGKIIPKGEHIALMWIAGNRDPRAFAKSNELKIERNNEETLVWGQGVHICQGASLARLEMRLAVEEMLSKTKLFELTDKVPRRAVYPSNGLSSLYLQFR